MNGGEDGGATILKLEDFEQVLVPLKNTKEADWPPQLRTFIIEMGEDPSNYQEEIMALQRLRQDMQNIILSCNTSAASNLTGLTTIVNYYRQLEWLSRRISLIQVSLSIVFTWSDAFDTSCSIKQSSIAFEKANLLFNIGALLSRLARGEEGPKYYQAAASLFHYIGENFLHPPLTDIMRPALTFLSALMLAQAQEAAVRRAWQEGKSSLAALARLAEAVAKHHSQASALIELPEAYDFKRILTSCGGEQDVCALLHAKRHSWRAIASYYRAEACYKEGKIGQAIGRVRLAEDLAKEALEQGTFPRTSKILQWMDTLRVHLGVRRALMERENGLIYSQAIPDESSLTVIEEATVVKVSPLADSLKWLPDRPDLFKRLVPLKVHEEISKYSEEKSKLLRYETLKVNTADNELQTTLASFGFPAALERLSARQSDQHVASKTRGRDHHRMIPEELLALRQQALQLARAVEAEEHLSLLMGRMREQLAVIDRLLDGEIVAYQKGNIQYGLQWTQAPSHTCNADLYGKLNIIQQDFVAEAERAGRLLCSLDPSIRSDMALLCGSEEALRAVLPRRGEEEGDGYDYDREHGGNVLLQLEGGKTRLQSRSQQQEELVCQVRLQLDHLERLCRERSRGLDRLKEAILSDDISDTLSLARPHDTDTLFHQELAKFDEPCRLLEENIREHNNLLEQFKRLWREEGLSNDERKKRQNERSIGGEGGGLRGELMARLTDSFHHYAHHLEALQKVTSRLEQIAQRAADLHQNCEHFSHLRAKERQAIERALQIEAAHRGQQYLLEKLRQVAPRRQSTGSKRDENGMDGGDFKGNVGSLLKTTTRPSAEGGPTRRNQSDLPPVLEPSLLD